MLETPLIFRPPRGKRQLGLACAEHRVLFCFENYTLDSERRELRRAGDLIAVEPQVFDILEHLIRNRDRVVSRDDLIDSIWGGRIISESTLHTRLNAVRSALADDGKQQRLVRTLPRKGFRFVGAVHEHEKPAVATASGPVVHSERRQLTVLSCELVPIGLSSRMELEDLHEAAGASMQCIGEVAARFAGHVAKQIGNIVLITFGHPVAHEDDAEQAVRAGLVISDIGQAAGADPKWKPRIGIATGEVLITNSTGPLPGEVLVGETPILSGRLQALARPGTVIVDKTTKSLLGELFECQELDPIEVPDLTETVRAWQVHAPRPLESRFAALRSGELTPLVGRHEELDLLQRRWAQATTGEGRVVLISGEPGIGKSRMVVALEQQIRSKHYIRFHYSCSPHHSDSALYPIIAQLERSAGFDRNDTLEQKFAKLHALLERTMAPAEDLALLAEILSVATVNQHLSSNLSSRRKKEKTAEALVRYVAASARVSPVLVIFEDAHWIDPSSFDFLSRMIESLAAVAVLVLVTFRSEFSPAWLGQSNVTMVTLNRLGRREGELVVRHVAGKITLSEEIVAAIADRTDGIPLFAEEVTKAVLEARESRGPNALALSGGLSSVPATLQASLMARLDRLGPGKQIAELGAAIGREFPYELLLIVSRQSEHDLQSSLIRLVESGLVLQRGVFPAATFIFKHALIQDTAYRSLLRERRRALHARIAQALQEHFPEITKDQPEVLAQHLEQADQSEHAITYWIAAGDLASRRSAPREAVVHYRAGLRSLEFRQSSGKICELEAEICMKLGNALMQSEGYGSSSAIEAYGRAQTRAAVLDHVEDHAKATSALAPLLFSSCNYREAIDTITAILHGNPSRLQPYTRIHLHTMLGVANYCLGNFIVAWEQLDTARKLDFDSPCTHDNPIGGGDPAVVLRNYMTMTGVVLGKIEESLALAEEGLSLARSRGDAFSLAWALLAHVRALRAMGRFAEGMPYANESVVLCERYGFRARLGTVLIARGTLLFGLGDTDRGIRDIQLGTNMWRETSGTFHMTEWLSYLIDRLWQDGRLVEAETALLEAEQIAEGTEEKYQVAELRRLRGNIVCRTDIGRAEVYLAEAIRWSRDRKAKVFELRARRDLARIYINIGRAEAAAALLKDGLSLFPESLIFSDLSEARQLFHYSPAIRQ
jgi:DNA-binding winged helix-turn-helix (wHTH) protein/tetratricopeptide (TPR) repeat protein